MRHNGPAEFLGIDVGQARIGLARGSAAARIAEPLTTVPAGTAILDIKAAIKANGTDAVVVGLPRSLDGEETAQTKAVRHWARTAKAEITLPFYWQDEALTSKAADKIAAGSQATDAVAASVMLQDFLDTPARQRVRC